VKKAVVKIISDAQKEAYRYVEDSKRQSAESGKQGLIERVFATICTGYIVACNDIINGAGDSHNNDMKHYKNRKVVTKRRKVRK